MEIDVALVPSEARVWKGTVCIVVDELRASSTLTTILDGGCSRLFVTPTLADAYRLARAHHGLLVGERGGYPPRGFDVGNSPVAIARLDIRGRVVILSTANGTRALSRLADARATLVGCLMNARACAAAAVEQAISMDARVGIVCAGTDGRFALDDAVAAGVIVDRLSEALRSRGLKPNLTEAAVAAVQLWSSYPDVLTPLRESVAGHLVARVGDAEDVPFCARVDVTATVPVLRRGLPLQLERLEAGSTRDKTARGPVTPASGE
jgi:2-phosphosulfolactate phosphatase